MNSHSRNKTKFELELSDFAIKFSAKKQQLLMHHNLLKKFDLDSLKSKVDNLDVDKIATFLADLRKLSNMVDKDIVKETV